MKSFILCFIMQSLLKYQTTQPAIRRVFQRVNLKLRWASKFYIGLSECHFQKARGLGVTQADKKHKKRV
jgi:hypothetical protein